VALMAIKGSLREASLADVVQLIYLGRRSGCLSVASDRNFGSIWFDDGWIVFASMLARTDRLGERLVAAGRLTQAELEQAVAAQAAVPGRRLGAVLVGLSLLTRAELDAELRRQVEETVYTLFTWTSGTFSFEAGVSPEEGEATVRLNPEGLLLEGARRVDEWSVIAKKIPSLDAVFAIEGTPRLEGQDATLVEIEQRIVPLLDGQRTARAIVDATGLTEFEVSRALYGLLSAGWIRRVATAAPPVERPDHARLSEHRNLGVAFYRTGMFAEAEREFRRVAEIAPADADGPFRLGLIALQRARWEDAIEALQRAMALGGRRPAMLHNLSLALEALGRLDEADAALADAIESDRDDPRLWSAWGLLALRRNEAALALERLARARELMRDVPPARWFWGCAWAQALNDSWPDAILTAREGVGAHPEHPVLRTTLGVLLEGTGEVGEAEAQLRKALAEDPTIPQVSKNLGDLCYRAGRWDEAEESYQRAAALAPALGDDLHFKLGNLACRRGDLDGARRHWQEAITLNPDHALARANLAGAGNPP
jgi:tetratricopeptide (TPR) repeat protein